MSVTAKKIPNKKRLEHICPPELQTFRRWCGWQAVPKTSGEGIDRQPIGRDGRRAKSTDSAGYCTFAEALEALETRDDWDGLNVATGGSGNELLAGFDFDGCVDDDGVVLEVVQDLVNEMDTYAEYSPSGRGVRIWCTVPADGARNISRPSDGFEFYSGSHFLSFTGSVLRKAPLRLIEFETVERALQRFLKAKGLEVPQPRESKAERTYTDEDPADVLRRVRQALRLLKPERARDYSDWLRVGLALRDAVDQLGEEYLEDVRVLWHQFSQRCPEKYDEGQADWKWESLFSDPASGKDRVTLGSLYAMAEEDGGEFRYTLGEEPASVPASRPSIISVPRQRLTTVTLDNVPETELRWLWRDRVPLGKLTMLVGHPGLGKTFACCDIAARVSRGERFPDGTLPHAGPVVFISSEDAAGDTIKPRLRVAGADLSQVIWVEGVETEGRQGLDFLDLDRHMGLMQDLLEQYRPALLIPDPLTALLGASVDANDNADVRRVLRPLCKLAEEHSCAILGMNHMNKRDGGHVLEKVLGSVGFVAQARAVWYVTEDPDDRERRLFVAAKSSVSRNADGLAFRITDQNGIGKVEWEPEPVNMRAADLQGEADETPRQEAIEWLRAALQAGPVPSREIMRRAKADGIAERTLKRAKKDEKVRSWQTDGHWVWGREDQRPATDEAEF